MISDLYEELVGDLTEGVTGARVYPVWPDRVQVPAVVVAVPRDRHLVSTAAFGGAVQLDVLFDVALFATDRDLSTLWGLAEQVLTLVTPAGWDHLGTDSPGQVAWASTTYLGAIVHLSKNSKI